jgi:EAL domain-containing protein (putative c-di-GMP-specific phosphodiesterase class I)
LREALRRGELKVAYQPIVRLGDGEITGFEALLRWHHPERGAVSPGDFIPLAEEYGLIGSLGEWVLTEACREATRWPKRLKLAVNLSPVQLRKPGFMLDVMRILATTGTLPDRLELEVTETALLDRDSATRLALGELRAIGVSVALDDFGTGYSSLRYLQAFAFDRLKIDMSFVRDIEDKHDSTSIVRAVLRLARDLGVMTTAEGVETERQRDWLKAEGCTEAQGYLFARPLLAEDLTDLLGAPVRRLDRAV